MVGNIIDVFEERVTIKASRYNCELRLPEEYVGCDCYITEKDNVKFDEDKISVINEDLVICKRLRPFRKGEARVRLPIELLNKKVIVFIEDF